MTSRMPSEPPSPDEQHNIAEIERLAAQGSGGLPALLEKLAAPSWVVRRRVIAAVARLGDAAIEPLCQMLRTRRDDEGRIAALVDTLSASAGSQLERKLLALTHDDNPAVVADAIQVLGRRRSYESVPTLVALTEHRDDNVAVAALEALGRIGGRAAVEALTRSVQSGSFFRTFPAIDVLGRSADPRAVPALAGLLDHPHYSLEAVRALGHTADRSAVPPLTALLARQSDTVARAAAVALRELDHGYSQRYGAPGVVEMALRGSAPPMAARRLAHAVAGATTNEQAAICWVLGALGDHSASEELMRLLDSEPGVAAAAAAALKRLERETDAELLEALRQGPSARRLVILPTLGGHYASAKDVVVCLNDDDAAVRALACETLARIGNPSVVPALFERLQDANVAVVHAAVGAIQSLGSAETEKLALEAARSGGERVRRAALRIIGYYGYADALPLLLEIVAGDNAVLRETAVEALPFIEDKLAMEALFEAARHPDAKTRAAAMRAFAQSARDLRVTSYLLRALQDPEPWVRYYACRSLGRIGWVPAAESISRLLSDEAGQVRVAAVEALSHLPSEIAFEALRDAATSTEPDLRRTALLGLGIGKWQQALPIIVEAARDRDLATRLVAVSALATFSDPEALETLGNAARDAEDAVRNAAIGFLSAHSSVEAARLLIGLLRDEDSSAQALSALSVPSPARLRGVIETLDTADDEIAPFLISALVRMQTPAATEGLIRASKSRSAAARRAAAPALGVVNTPDTLAALGHMSSSDEDPEVRRVAALVLSR